MNCELCLDEKPLLSLTCAHRVCAECDAEMRIAMNLPDEKPCVLLCSGKPIIYKNESYLSAIMRTKLKLERIKLKNYEKEKEITQAIYDRLNNNRGPIFDFMRQTVIGDHSRQDWIVVKRKNGLLHTVDIDYYLKDSTDFVHSYHYTINYRINGKIVQQYENPYKNVPERERTHKLKCYGKPFRIVPFGGCCNILHDDRPYCTFTVAENSIRTRGYSSEKFNQRSIRDEDNFVDLDCDKSLIFLIEGQEKQGQAYYRKIIKQIAMQEKTPMVEQACDFAKEKQLEATIDVLETYLEYESSGLLNLLRPLSRKKATLRKIPTKGNNLTPKVQHYIVSSNLQVTGLPNGKHVAYSDNVSRLFQLPEKTEWTLNENVFSVLSSTGWKAFDIETGEDCDPHPDQLYCGVVIPQKGKVVIEKGIWVNGYLFK